jgi:hypothetical protein
MTVLERTQMNPKSALSSAVDAWHRLWRVGANGNNINSQSNKSNHPSHTTNPNNSNRPTKKPRSKQSNPNFDPNNSTPRTTKQRRSKHHREQPLPTRIQPPNLSQTNLLGQNQDALDVEAFGDNLNKKHDTTIRIMLHNINRLPLDHRTDKSRKLISCIANKQIDVAMITEVGLYWKSIPGKDRWYERVRESFQTHKSEMAFNTTEPSLSSSVQFGGVGIMATDDCSHRVVSQGSDPTGLGRWAWLRLEGKDGHHLRLASAYRPVDSIGPGTVYAQHERYFASQYRDVDPRQAFYDDLFDEVQKWKALGDHIVVGLDANDDVRYGPTADTF